jgi:hypothetical protein
MAPNANYSEVCCGNQSAAALLEGSVDTYDAAPAPSCGQHPASLSFPEAYSVECCQPQRFAMRPKSDLPGFRMGRPRSLAIPIESKSKAEVDDSEEIPESGSMYDKATWRMYNRITYHRQKHPVEASQNAMIPRLVQQATDLTNPQWYRMSDNINLTRDVVYPTLFQCSDCSLLDDEIFEFEL